MGQVIEFMGTKQGEYACLNQEFVCMGGVVRTVGNVCSRVKHQMHSFSFSACKTVVLNTCYEGRCTFDIIYFFACLFVFEEKSRWEMHLILGG